MNNEKMEIIKLTSKEILLSIFDLSLPFFESSQIYRINAKKYHDARESEHINHVERMKYLKKHGLINHFVEGKEKYIEITAKGLGKISKYTLDAISIDRSEKWDGKWRVIIFDISEEHKPSRNTIRLKLLELGFEKIQDSVYAYPFECTKEIAQIAAILSESDNILIMISEIIQNEEKLIAKFLDKNTLTKSDLK